MGESLLDVRLLNKAFGTVVTAKDLNFSLHSGVITSIIGPNGAGKSTLINVLTGLLAADSGEIWFQGREVTREPIYKRVKLGLGRSFQVVNVFANLTVFENLAIPVLALKRETSNIFRSVARLRDVHGDVEKVLNQVGLLDQAYMIAQSLSHGDQRLL